MYALVALGLCVLVAWTIACLIRRRKFLEASGPGRRSRLTVLHVMLPLLCALLVGGLAGFLLPKGLPYSLIAGAAGSVAMIAASLVAGSHGIPLGLGRGMGLSARHWLYDTARGVLGYLAVLPVCLGVLEVTTRIMMLWGFKPAPHRLLEILRQPGAHWGSVAMAIILAVVLAPLTEEIFYRGLIQTALRRHLKAWPAIMLTAVLFAAMHLDMPNSVPAMLVFGMALGYQYERTGRLWASIVMHLLFNAVFVTATMTAGV
ncbi:MAG: type II CAAX endopeptidase family protein [Planctomycetaceae bacterium]|nr:CPBP family intramembrane metalloprotease [Planctomycetaceae bacterium]